MNESDSLKSLGDLTKPDPRSGGLGFFGSPRLFRPKNIDDHHAEAVAQALDPAVPEDVHQHFETARVVYMHAWFGYRLLHVADLHALGSLELALRLRFAGRRLRGLAQLLEHAIDHLHLVDDRMRVWQRRERTREMQQQEEDSWPADFRELFGSARPVAEVADHQVIVKRLVRSLPRLRNVLAHGSPLLAPQGVIVLELCCDLINQLFPAVEHGTHEAHG